MSNHTTLHYTTLQSTTLLYKLDNQSYCEGSMTLPSYILNQCQVRTHLPPVSSKHSSDYLVIFHMGGCGMFPTSQSVWHIHCNICMMDWVSMLDVCVYVSNTFQRRMSRWEVHLGPVTQSIPRDQLSIVDNNNNMYFMTALHIPSSCTQCRVKSI